MIKVNFLIERETEKAVFCEVRSGYAHNTTRYAWLPKSACEFEEYVETVNPVTNEPKTYGKYVSAIADWLARKLR